MEVLADASFPRVIEYNLGGDKFDGSPEKLRKIKINGDYVTPKIKSYLSEDKTSVKYELEIKERVDALITANISVSENVMTFEISDIKNFSDAPKNSDYDNFILDNLVIEKIKTQ